MNRRDFLNLAPAAAIPFLPLPPMNMKELEHGDVPIGTQCQIAFGIHLGKQLLLVDPRSYDFCRGSITFNFQYPDHITPDLMAELRDHMKVNANFFVMLSEREHKDPIFSSFYTRGWNLNCVVRQPATPERPNHLSLRFEQMESLPIGKEVVMKWEGNLLYRLRHPTGFMLYKDKA